MTTFIVRETLVKAAIRLSSLYVGRHEVFTSTLAIKTTKATTARSHKTK